MTMAKMMRHYLLTITPDPAVHLHCYVMTNDKRNVMAALNKMLEVAESTGARFVPIVLQTELRDEADTVRDIISKDEKVKQTLAAAKDFHVSIFGMEVDSPDDRRLIKLH